MILITGAAGLSGTIIVQEFARRGIPVRALVRSRTKASLLETLPGVEVVEGDMRRPETLGRALEGVDRALMISSSDPQMVETQCSFIDASRKAGVRHVVKFSGKESSIDFNPANFRFTRMHEEIERYLESSGLAWTHLRPSQFMQVYLRELPTIVAKRAIFLPMDNSKLTPVDIEDVAKVAVEVMSNGSHHSKSYEMTGPEALTMVEVAAQISRAVGKQIEYINVAPEEKRRALLAAGVPGERTDALDELFAERRKCHESRVYVGTHKAFGVKPTTFAKFAERNATLFSGGSAV